MHLTKLLLLSIHQEPGPILPCPSSKTNFHTISNPSSLLSSTMTSWWNYFCVCWTSYQHIMLNILWTHPVTHFTSPGHFRLVLSTYFSNPFSRSLTWFFFLTDVFEDGLVHLFRLCDIIQILHHHHNHNHSTHHSTYHITYHNHRTITQK